MRIPKSILGAGLCLSSKLFYVLTLLSDKEYTFTCLSLNMVYYLMLLCFWVHDLLDNCRWLFDCVLEDLKMV